MEDFADVASLDAVVQDRGVDALLDRLDGTLDRRADPDGARLRDALAMSAAVLREDPRQLPAQLSGRLRGLRSTAGLGRAWLCPTTPTLTPPRTRLRRVLRGTEDFVTAVAVSEDGRTAVAGSYGREVRVWDLSHGRQVSRFVGGRPGASYPEGAGGDAIVSVVLVGHTVFAASADRCLYVVDSRSGTGEMVVQGETDNLWAVALSADAQTMVAAPRDIWGPTDFDYQVWDVPARRQVSTLPGPGHYIDRLAVTPGGDIVASLSTAGALTVLDSASGRVRWTEAAGGLVVALSADGSLVATGHEDGEVVVRRTDGGGGAILAVRGGQGRVTAICFAEPDRLVSATADGRVTAFDVATGEPVHELPAQGSPVQCVTATESLHVLACGHRDGSLRVWDPSAAREEPVGGHAAPVVAAAVSTDGETAATLDATGHLLRWRVFDGRAEGGGTGDADELPRLVGEPRPDGGTRSTRERVEALEQMRFGGDASSEHEVTGVAVTGTHALVSSRHRTVVHYRLGVSREETHVRLWSLGDGEVVRDLAATERQLVHGGHVDAYRCVAIADGGSLGAGGGDDRTLRLWDLASGEEVAAFTGESGLTACAMSADGSVLVAGEVSGRVHLLRLRGRAPGPSDVTQVAVGRSPLSPRAEGPDAEGGQVEHVEPARRGRSSVALGRKASAKRIEKYLERFGLEAMTLPGTDPDHGACLTALGVEGHGYMVSVVPNTDVGQLDFRVAGLLHATLDDTPADRVHGLLLALAVLNYRIPLGSLGYDPTDGEVALRFSLPMTDGEVRYEDFERVLVVLENVLAKHAADLRAVVAGEKTAAEILR